MESINSRDRDGFVFMSARGARKVHQEHIPRGRETGACIILRPRKEDVFGLFDCKEMRGSLKDFGPYLRNSMMRSNPTWKA